MPFEMFQTGKRATTGVAEMWTWFVTPGGRLVIVSGVWWRVVKVMAIRSRRIHWALIELV